MDTICTLPLWLVLALWSAPVVVAVATFRAALSRARRRADLSRYLRGIR